jgi:hypothetical protein
MRRACFLRRRAGRQHGRPFFTHARAPAKLSLIDTIGARTALSDCRSSRDNAQRMGRPSDNLVHEFCRMMISEIVAQIRSLLVTPK